MKTRKFGNIETSAADPDAMISADKVVVGTGGEQGIDVAFLPRSQVVERRMHKEQRV